LRLIPIILAVALFMEQMDSTVIATSLPAIAEDIGSDPISLKLALTAYFVSLAIFIPISGWVAERYGAKSVFRIAIAVFMVGSICCAFSDSLLAFVLSRFLQGIGGSMMTPVARLVLLRSTPRSQLVSAMAWLTIPAMIGPMTGPLLGGFLTTYQSWHWIFWINIPIGVLGIALVTRFLPEIRGGTARPIDLPGAALCGIAFSGIMFGFSVISLPAIPAVAGYAAIVVGFIAGLLYLRHAKRTAHPILDPQLFRRPLFRDALLGSSLYRIGIGAFPFLMPLMLQLTFGLSPFESGLTTFVSAIGAMLSKLGAQWLYATAGFRNTLMTMAILGSLFLGINGLFTPETPHLLLMGALLMGGVLRSFFFTGANALVFSDVDDARAGQATSINSVAQQLSIAAGVAVAGGALELTTHFHGGGLTLEDFHIAWFIVAFISVLSIVAFLRMPPDAGSEVSGHRVRGAVAKPAE
jgi:EmrB/QacA subfamily drug resistance transporter